MSEADFQVQPSPDSLLLTELERLYPANPFSTATYFEALRLSGQHPVALLVRARGGELLGGCLGTISHGRVITQFRIPSAPAFRGDEVLWHGLDELGVRGQMHYLSVGTFGSEPQTACNLTNGRVSSTNRSEFWLDLAQDQDLLTRMGSNHRRNYKRAVKAGYVLRSATDERALQRHAELVDASTERRASKGSAERAGFVLDFPLALLRTGAARLYQVCNGGDVASSMLALHSMRGAYYHSAGTTPNGMSSGASHFLVHEIARTLQAENFARFNLGGVSPDQDGLRRFKTGFGTIEIPLTASIALYGSPLRHRVAAIVASLRHRLSGT